VYRYAVDFLRINPLTHTHFAKRHRMGRSLAFLAPNVQDGWSANPRQIAVDENWRVLAEGDGNAWVIGPGNGAYFLEVRAAPSVSRAGTPLSLPNLEVCHTPRNSRFNLENLELAGRSFLLTLRRARSCAHPHNGTHVPTNPKGTLP